MAKSELRIKARELRKRGMSIRDIAKNLPASKSTVSLWCRDIELTAAQTDKLLENKLTLGQLRGAAAQKEKRLKKVRFYEQEGEREFKKISREQFFIAGLVLYLAEGTKVARHIDFTNSDPRVIGLMTRWFHDFFDVPISQMRCAILINESHRSRELIVKNFWSEHLGIPLTQFRKTIFLKSVRKKIYDNHDNYYGTMKLRTLKSSDLCYRIIGLIHGFMSAVSKI